MWFSLSVPGSSRYLETIHDLVARLAQQSGYPRPDASAIAASVRDSVTGALDRGAAPGGEGTLSLGLATHDTTFEVTMRFNGRSSAGDSAAVIPWGHVRPGAMDRVDVIEEGGACVCRMSKALPPQG